MFGGNGRTIAIFGGLFLISQMLQIYVMNNTRQVITTQLSRSVGKMDDLRLDLSRTVERAMRELEKELKEAAQGPDMCRGTKKALKDIRDILDGAVTAGQEACKPARAVDEALGASRQNGSKCARSYVGMTPPETCHHLKGRHVAIITIDSLRWDTAVEAKAPWFTDFFKRHNHTGWERRLGHATFSLPAHIVILHGGSFGTRGYLQQHKDPQRLFGFMLNWMAGDWATMKPPRYIMPEAANLVKAFEKCGYETIGVGGVSWFNDIYETTDLWARDYFQKFVWREHFTPSSDDAFEYQLSEAKQLMENRDASMPLFFFMNVPTVHFPYRHSKLEGWAKQLEAYEYVDEHFQTLLDLLPRPLQLIVQADHGECFTDGCHGHGTAHPGVFDIPFFEIILEEGEGYSDPDPDKRRQPRYEWTPRRRGEFFHWNI